MDEERRISNTALLVVSTLGVVQGCVAAADDTYASESIAQAQQALERDTNGVWRPFSDDSPWNSRVDDHVAVDAQSAEMIADWSTSSPYGSYLWVNRDAFSIPLYWADERTPRQTVRCEVGGSGFAGDNGIDASAEIPMPDGASPDAYSDGHLLVVDRTAQREWGLFRAQRAGDGWHCGLGADMDLRGDGVRPIAQSNPTWYTSHGARACGFPLVAGLIRPEEVRAGRIEHALVTAYPHIRAGIYTPPASTAQNTINEAIKSRGIPCGGRIQLDPALDLDSLELSEGARVIARALQEYGAYVGDYSDSLSLYADNSPEALAQWDEIPLDDLNKLDLEQFRVLELGTLYDNGNGD